ncbi:MAG: Trm112 family protein [Chloroflexi bacterium]|nr:Trm112 family protein [Chloroflexota bacterium]
MVDEQLLEILVCPETKQPVRLAERDLLERLNQAIEAGNVKTRDGRQVDDRVEEGLVREDDRVLYPVRDSIPIMLIDEGIALEGLVKTT